MNRRKDKTLRNKRLGEINCGLLNADFADFADFWGLVAGSWHADNPAPIYGSGLIRAGQVSVEFEKKKREKQLNIED